MKNLIIYAHPKTSGHAPYLLSRVKKELEKRSWEYEILDLYEMKYDPVLHENEHYTAGGKEVSEENRKIQKQIKNCERIILIYPLWWGDMPAILKGFFDKILTARFAFQYEGGLPKRLLEGKKALVFMTSGESIRKLKLWGNRPKKIIQKDILGFCGVKTEVFQIGRCLKFCEAKQKEISNLVSWVFSKLE